MNDFGEVAERADPLQRGLITLTAAGISHAIAFFDLSLFPTFR